MRTILARTTFIVACLLLTLAVGNGPEGVRAQEQGDRRIQQTQTEGAPEQIVSFRPDTPFAQFVRLLNPLFERETGKQIVDPEGRRMPIGIPVSGMHYRNAFQRVLQFHGLSARETETVFLIESDAESAEQEEGRGVDNSSSEQATPELPASLTSREIRINAILFDVNLSKVRELGLNWSQLWGRVGENNRRQSTRPTRTRQRRREDRFYVNTEDLFSGIRMLNAPAQMELGRLVRFFRVLEQEQVGNTIANPQVTVQSGEQGEIQIGQDIPIQTQDFSGNTITQFYKTGIIVDVVPTLIEQPVADTAGAPKVEFIHLDVRVEDSNTSPSASGPIINRNQATTQVLLLDKEATAIGGLITTQETTSRSGVPGLKDLPPWVFGLRYIFGRETKNRVQRELLIVLRAEIVDPLQVRAADDEEGNLLEKRREHARDALRKLGGQYEDAEEFPRPDTTDLE